MRTSGRILFLLEKALFLLWIMNWCVDQKRNFKVKHFDGFVVS